MRDSSGFRAATSAWTSSPVISGYLITTILLDDFRRGEFSIKAFYDRRVRRILPALFAVLLASTIAALAVLTPREMVDYAKSLAAVALFPANIYFWREGGYFDTDAELQPLLHTWSLAVEEQYYILFPLLLLVLLRRCRSERQVALLLAGVGRPASRWGCGVRTGRRARPSSCCRRAPGSCWWALAWQRGGRRNCNGRSARCLPPPARCWSGVRSSSSTRRRPSPASTHWRPRWARHC
ncbi:acyltransferase [Ramlibacter terrae]|uniref:Acyltransferase n=1 Tax=Ramlibacter terrae TaxID=2732511 RepID=A0ABX6P216_9BURK|nr:acyltransferase [Ramlibacter terrae]